MGEVEFGLLPGVHATRSGWIGKIEVVEVAYDPKVQRFAKLLAHGHGKSCAAQVFTDEAQERALAVKELGAAAVHPVGQIREEGVKYHLTRTFYGELAMTPGQAMRLNATLGRRERPSRSQLSPRQWALLERVRDRRPEGPFEPRALRPIIPAWRELEAWLKAH